MRWKIKNFPNKIKNFPKKEMFTKKGYGRRWRQEMGVGFGVTQPCYSSLGTKIREVNSARRVPGFSHVLVVQSCPTFCNPIDSSPPSSFVHGDSPGKNTTMQMRPRLTTLSTPAGRLGRTDTAPTQWAATCGEDWNSTAALRG